MKFLVERVDEMVKKVCSKLIVLAERVDGDGEE